MRVVLILLLVAAPLSAIDVHGEFQVGCNVEEPLAFTYLRLEVPVSLFTLYGSWHTLFEVRLPNAYPFRDIYEVGARLDWRNLFLDVNHFCDHPVFSGQRDDWDDLRVGVSTTVSVGVRW